MHKNNKHQNQSSSFRFGRAMESGRDKQENLFCKALFIKIGGGYTCAITKKKKKKSYMELTIVPKMKLYIVREQVLA